MPTYQYACTACAERLEAVQSFSDPALTECPACGGALRKVFSAVGVVFKGSGFYKTDSRASNGKSEKVDAATSSDSGSGDKAAKAAGSTESSGSANGSSAAGSTGAASGTGSSGKNGSSGGSTASKPTVSTPASKSA